MDFVTALVPVDPLIVDEGKESVDPSRDQKLSSKQDMHRKNAHRAKKHLCDLPLCDPLRYTHFIPKCMCSLVPSRTKRNVNTGPHMQPSSHWLGTRPRNQTSKLFEPRYIHFTSIFSHDRS